jgi:predicted peptidase
MNEYMRMMFEIADGLLAEYPIDRDRIYVTGGSMGGFGTFEAVSRRPQFFAAAVPICGGHDEACAPLMVDTPIWAFHGDKDDCINVQRTRNMIDAIRAAGGTPVYWEYAGVGHTSVRDLAYDDPRLIEWIFAQSRKTRSAP